MALCVMTNLTKDDVDRLYFIQAGEVAICAPWMGNFNSPTFQGDSLHFVGCQGLELAMMNDVQK